MSVRRINRLLCLLFLCLGVCVSASAQGAAPALSIQEMRLGENASLALGEETTLALTLENTGGDFEGILALNVYQNQQSYIRYELPIALPSGKTATFTLPFHILSMQPAYTAEIWQGNELILSRTEAASPFLPAKNNNIFAITSPLSASQADDFILVENASSAWPMIVCLGVYLLLGVAGGYFLLKKVKKRQWLWVLIPILSILCTVAVALVGAGQDYHTPAAVTLCVYDLEDDEHTPDAIARISALAQNEMVLSSPGLDVGLSSLSINTYLWDEKNPESTSMYARLILEENQSLGLPWESDWRTNTITVQGLPWEDIQITGALWPEDKGIRGYVKNQSEYDLHSCVVFTEMGLATLPSLKAGEQAEFSLLPEEGYSGTSYADGRLLYLSASPDASQLIYPLSHTLYEEEWKNADIAARYDTYNKRSALVGTMSNILNHYANTDQGIYQFIGFSDDLGRFALQANGEKITKQGHMGIVTARLDYQSAGPQGDIWHFPGHIQPTQGKLEGETPADTGLPFESISDFEKDVILCYTCPDWAHFQLEELQVRFAAMANRTLSIYNFQSRAWEELDHSICWDENEGSLYVQEGKTYLRTQRIDQRIYRDGIITIPQVGFQGREK